MSVFSVIKRGRQQAKERARKQADSQEKGPEKPPYKHVPTHAAQDALSSAPPTWRIEDRSRILEQNRKRNAVAGGVNPTPGQSGAPRFSSGLSNVMYPSAHASPLVSVSRSHSRNEGTVYLAWPYRQSDPIPYSTGETYVPSLPSISSLEEKHAEVPMVDSVRSGSSASKGILSGGLDSDVSSTSQGCHQEGDVRNSKLSSEYQRSSNNSRHSQPPQATEVSGIHRLHPSRPRRWSDGSETATTGYNSQRKHPQALTSSRDSRPPPSMRGFNAIPPPPSFPPLQIPHHLYHSTSSLSSSTASTVSSSSASTTATTPSSTTSSPLGTTPIIPSAADFVFPFVLDSSTTTHLNQPVNKLNNSKSPTGIAARSQPQDPATRRKPVPTQAAQQMAREPPTNTHAIKHRDARMSKTIRFPELETILPDTTLSFPTTSSVQPSLLERKYSAPPQLSNEVISRALARQSGTPSPVEAISVVEESKSKGKPFKRRPSKLSKQRWSTGNSPPAAAV